MEPSRSALFCSYPVDHHDPWIRNYVDASDKLYALVAPFLDLVPDTKNLRQLGDVLGPDQKVTKAANQVIHKVQVALANCLDVSLDRTCVSGSYGKRTSLAKFDIDFVIFVNNESPPFASLLQTLKTYLNDTLIPAESLKIKKTTRFSLQFLFQGFKVDLLPATNLAVSEKSMPIDDLQYESLLLKLKSMSHIQREKDIRYWSAGFAEATVAYIKQQSPFCNAAIRICKLWKLGCNVTDTTFPLWFTSFLVEIVAVEMAQAELRDHPHDASILRVLHKFLRALSEPLQLKILPSGRKYQTEDIPSKILKERPLVLDPVNPFNNLATKLGDWNTIRQLALSTLESLNQSKTMKEIFSPRLGNDVTKLYEWCNFQLRFVMNGTYLRSLGIHRVKDLDAGKRNPYVEWRKDLQPHAREAKNQMEGMLRSLVNISTTAMLHRCAQTNSAKDTNNNNDVKKASDFVDDMLLEVFGKPKQEWVPASESHNDKDITLTFGQIPLPSPAADDLCYIQLVLSFNVCEHSLYRIAHDIDRSLERQEEEENEEYY